ncbi:MAG: hypothetical protein RLZZ127_3081 [Planctomycetota bacterium]|jgi:hypothetical protein
MTAGLAFPSLACVDTDRRWDCPDADGLADLVTGDGNLRVWQRRLPEPFRAWVESVDPDRLADLDAAGPIPDALAQLDAQIAALPGPAAATGWWRVDVRRLVAAWARASRSAAVHIQIEVVRGDQCRKFHTDLVRMRLLCTYRGPGTEWLPDAAVRRNRLGAQGGNGDIVADPAAVRRAGTGDALLFLGDLHDPWRPGLVHRSPPIAGTGAVRVLLRIDASGACGCGRPHGNMP